MCAGCVLSLLESVGSQQPASLLSSGVSLKDQAPYVCEARNAFGKAQAEARLVVTGHGLWVNLETVGSGRQVPQGAPWISTFEPLGPDPREHPTLGSLVLMQSWASWGSPGGWSVSLRPV